MVEYSADYLRRLRSAIEQFEKSFNAWMQTQDESTHMESRGLLPTVNAKEGQDDANIRALELDVAEAAGLAERAVKVTGAYIAVQGLGLVDPIASWSFMAEPKAPIAPRDIRLTASRVKGRLDAMITDAETRDEFSLPSFSPAELHKVIWTAAAAHWTTHQYRVAVREASKAFSN